MPVEHTYIAIDLKSFYASVECVERHLDPLQTNLVVADAERTDKTVCLAVTPSLKAYGISGRARLFEVVQRVREVNWERQAKIADRQFKGKSVFEADLKQHTDLQLDYIVAKPRMARYIAYSSKIYAIYLKYVSAEDIHVYSIDEVFMDVTGYLDYYQMDARTLAQTMIRDVLQTTGITATAGIGSNLYLCKVAMDVVAKHVAPDEHGVRIAELDELSYRKTLWDHKPLTDFWRFGGGIVRRLAYAGVDTMGKLARLSLDREDWLYREFGVNAELLIDHAWGWEPCPLSAIKRYRPSVHSVSSGQVLTCAYACDKARVVVGEMLYEMALGLVDKRLMTNQLTLHVMFDSENLQHMGTAYQGAVCRDHYGRFQPKPVRGSVTLPEYTSSAKLISDAVLSLYDRLVDERLLVRRLNITAEHVVREEYVREEDCSVQLDLFVDYEQEFREREARQKQQQKERRVQEAVLDIKKRFGKNAVLQGLNFAEGATQKERNQQIGGHKA